MKPYQSAWDVACWINQHKNKHVNYDCITEYFRAGMERELQKITNSSYKMLDIMDDVNAWQEELIVWLLCWYTWTTSPDFH